jgi:hypothetical protein
MNDEQLQEVYIWVDEVPLSRPKKNIHRDFSDGVLIAEIVHHYFPHLVELHNYPSSHSVKQKEYNWNTLKEKCFKRMNFPVKKELLLNCARAVPGAVEKLLFRLKHKLESGTVSQQPARRLGPPTHIAKTGENLRSQQDSGKRPSGQQYRGPPVVDEEDDVYVSSGLRDQQQQPPPRGGGDYYGNPGGGAVNEARRQVDAEILVDKEQTILELRETVEILEVGTSPV